MKRFALAPVLLGLVALGSSCAPSVTANTRNSAPVANAGRDFTTNGGGAISLDGSRSYDPDEDELTYFWSVDSAPADSAGGVEFSINESRNAVRTSFTPDTQGLWVLRLVVCDEVDECSVSDFVAIEVTASATLPIAEAGANQSAIEGEEICFNGLGSYDPSGGTLSYNWTLSSIPDNSELSSADLTGADGAEPCLTTDAPGTYGVALVVDNGLAASQPDFAFASVSSTNIGPTATGELASPAYSCGEIALTGGTSSDPDGDDLVYQWRLLLSPVDSDVSQDDILNADQPEAVFYADVTGRYVLSLTVSDGEDFSTPSLLDFEVTERPFNEAPVAVAPPAISFEATASCVSDAYTTTCPPCGARAVEVSALESFDPDGDSLTYRWFAVDGEIGIDDPESATTTVTLRGADSTFGATQQYVYQLGLEATDCLGETHTAIAYYIYSCTGM